MSVEGFHSEWLTVGKHRVFLEARASFPDEEHHFIAKVVATLLDHHSKSARLVKIFYDDKACVYSVDAATTNETDKPLESLITQVLHEIFNSGNYFCNLTLIKKGDESSDHYDHMEYLSVNSDVAADRWSKS